MERTLHLERAISLREICIKNHAWWGFDFEQVLHREISSTNLTLPKPKDLEDVSLFDKEFTEDTTWRSSKIMNEIAGEDDSCVLSILGISTPETPFDEFGSDFDFTKSFVYQRRRMSEGNIQPESKSWEAANNNRQISGQNESFNVDSPTNLGGSFCGNEAASLDTSFNFAYRGSSSLRRDAGSASPIVTESALLDSGKVPWMLTR